jgi:hypothetical protein
MSAIPPDDHDPALDSLLRQWKVEPPLPPRFQEGVWRRIARAEKAAPSGAPLGGWIAWAQGFLSRPSWAASYVTALLVGGFVLGWARGLEKTARVEKALSSRYVQVVDPFQETPPGP